MCIRDRLVTVSIASTAETVPVISLPLAERVTVASWPTWTSAMSASATLAVTCSESVLVRVTNPVASVVEVPLKVHCLIYTSDAADDLICVNHGDRHIHK